MLQWLRENLKSFSWTLWVVIIAFILLYIPDLVSGGGPSGDTLAKVGGEEVSIREYQRQHQQLEQQFRDTFGAQYNQELAEQLQLPRQALSRLVNDKILLAEARRHGLTVTDDELQKAIVELPVFQDEGGRFVGGERYQNLVRRIGYRNAEEFEDTFREDMLVQKLYRLLTSNLYLPDSEVEESYRRQTEKAKVRYLVLPGSRYAAEVEVTPEELAAHYEERREEYRRPEQRTASYVLLDINQLRASLQPTQEELQAYYDGNVEQFTQPDQVRTRHILLRANDERSDEQAEAQLNEIKQRIAGGEDFAALALELSDDTSSAQRGGELGFYGRGSLVPEYEQAAFSAQVGELVGPVKTVHGYHLIELLERREAGQQPLSEVENQIRFRLQNEQAQEVGQQRIDALYQRILDEGLTSDEALSALADEEPELTFDTAGPFSVEDPLTRLGRAPAFNTAAFGLAAGEIGGPVRVPRGWTVLRLDEVREPQVPELSEVEAEVRADLVRQRQQELAMAALEAVEGQLAAGELTLDAAAEQLGVAVQESELLAAGQPVPGLAQGAAVINRALTMEEGEVGGPLEQNLDALLFQVAEREFYDPLTFAAESDQIRLQLEGERLQQVLSSVVAGRRREMEINYNSDWMQRIGLDGPAQG